MLEGTVEAEQDFAALLEATDTSNLPDPLDLSQLSVFERAVVNWMAGRKKGDELPLSELDDDGMLGEAVKVAFARGGGPGDLDFFALREGLQYGYHCSRPLPPDLDTLRERFGEFTEWSLNDIDCGLPKDERRMVWYHPELHVVVAETVDEDGAVRETEVLFWSLRDDEQLDFAAYDEEGRLMDRSTFATAGGVPTTFGAPYICVSCHMGYFSVNEQNPEGLGAGCRQ
jgi:hypothetical protein